MNPMADMFDFNKTFDLSKTLEPFTKMYPDFNNTASFAAPMKAATDMAEKCRAVAVEAMNKNVELTTAWMKDAAKDAESFMKIEAEPTAYAKKAGEFTQTAMQDLPARMFAFAEVAKKAQTELFETVVAATPKTVEAAAKSTKTATKAAAKKAA